MSFTRILGTEDRKVWLEARRTGIGASDAPSLFGCGFQSALAVYEEKISTEPVEDDSDSELTRWGKLLEPLILAELQRETGRRIEAGGQLLRSREWPWMLATLDAEQACSKRPSVGTVEAKATRWLGDEWKSGPPKRPWIQMQQQLAVTGRSWGSCAVLIGGSEFKWADVERDDHFINDILVPAGEEFWKRVQERRPPPPDGSDSARAAIKKLFPEEIPGKILQLGGELIEFDDELQGLKKDKRAVETRIQQIEDSIKMAIGDAEAGVLANGTTFTYLSQSRAEYIVKATTFRVLRRRGD